MDFVRLIMLYLEKIKEHKKGGALMMHTSLYCLIMYSELDSLISRLPIMPLANHVYLPTCPL